MTIAPSGAGRAAGPAAPLSPLRTGELAAIFRDTSSSYKYFWFLALIDLLPEAGAPLAAKRIVQAMVIRAWAASALFRLSLGKIDRLQACVRAAQDELDLPPRISRSRLADALASWPSLDNWVEELSRFVPGRFLGTWFPEVARKAPYDRRGGSRAVADAAADAWGTPASGPYRLGETGDGLCVELAPEWRRWLGEHQSLVTGYAEMQLAQYLQARNPDVPAIILKLDIPRRRSLRQAREAWEWVRDHHAEAFRDIFAQGDPGDDFEVDHFLPWAFTAHDEFWNLCPVMPAVNRDKSDRLPAIDIFLPRLAALHADIMTHRDLPPGLAASYARFMNIAPDALFGLDRAAIGRRYDDVVRPLAQIAANQGFPSNWTYRTAAVRPTFRMRTGDKKRELIGSRGAQGVYGDQNCG